MFLAWCDTRNQNVLIGPTYIQGLTNTDQGMILSYACHCGQPGQMFTGTATGKTIGGHTTPIPSTPEKPAAA